MKIYVASSWRNKYQPEVVKKLQSDRFPDGQSFFDVYDFRNPAPGNKGFAWSEIDPDWQNWGPVKFRDALKHPLAHRGFQYDMTALRECDACVLVLPCGRSAHAEAGWAAGAGKKVVVYMPESCEPELMYKMFNAIVTNTHDLVGVLEEWRMHETRYRLDQ